MSEFLNPDGTEWVPQHDRQAPPFQKGNRMSVGNRGPMKHGANSSRRYLPLAKEHEAELKKIPGLEYLWEPEFRDLTWAYCVAEARAELAGEWVDQMEVGDSLRAPEGGVTSPAEVWRELATSAATLAAKLGLFPRVKPEVREAIDRARERIATRKARRAAKDAEREAMRLAFWRSQSPQDFDAEGKLRSVEDRLSDPSYRIGGGA